MSKRKHLTPEQKVAVIRRHLIENVPVSDLCEELGVHPNQYYNWQKTFFENGASVFKRKPNRWNESRQKTAQAKKSEMLETKLQDRNEVVAELMQEVRPHSEVNSEIVPGNRSKICQWIRRHWYLSPLFLFGLAILSVLFEPVVDVLGFVGAWLAFLSVELALFVVPFERRSGQPDKRRHITIGVFGVLLCVILLGLTWALTLPNYAILMCTVSVMVPLFILLTTKQWQRNTLWSIGIESFIFPVYWLIAIQGKSYDSIRSAIASYAVNYANFILVGMVLFALGIHELAVFILRRLRTKDIDRKNKIVGYYGEIIARADSDASATE